MFRALTSVNWFSINTAISSNIVWPCTHIDWSVVVTGEPLILEPQFDHCMVWLALSLVHNMTLVPRVL